MFCYILWTHISGQLSRLPANGFENLKNELDNFLSLSSQTGPEYGQGMNPISRLAQIQQAKKEKEPEYLLLSERGMPRRREFIMQVDDHFLIHILHFPTFTYFYMTALFIKGWSGHWQNRNKSSVWPKADSSLI